MKKRICNFCVMALMGITSLSAFDLNELLKSATSGNNSSASDIISGIVNAVTSTSVEYADLVGNWKYSKPAVTFSSDNLLQNAGGAAASTTIVNKLKPYYTKARLNNMTLTFGSDSTFVAKTTRLSVSGTVTSLGNGAFQFNIKALGKIPAGSITASCSTIKNAISAGRENTLFTICFILFENFKCAALPAFYKYCQYMLSSPCISRIFPQKVTKALFCLFSRAKSARAGGSGKKMH